MSSVMTEALTLIGASVERLGAESPAALLARDPLLTRLFCETYLRRRAPPVLALLSACVADVASSSGLRRTQRLCALWDARGFAWSARTDAPARAVALALPADVAELRFLPAGGSVLCASGRAVAVALFAPQRRKAPELLVWDAAAGGPPTLRIPLLPVRSPALAACNERWLCVAERGDLLVWRLSDAAPAPTARVALPVEPRSACFAAPDAAHGPRLAVLGVARDALGELLSTAALVLDVDALRLWPAASGETFSEQSPAMQLIDDGRAMLLERRESRLEVVETATLRTLRAWPQVPFWSVTLPVGLGTSFATFATNGALHVWTVDRDQPLRSFEGVASAACRAGFAFALGHDGVLTAVDCETGNDVWAANALEIIRPPLLENLAAPCWSVELF